MRSLSGAASVIVGLLAAVSNISCGASSHPRGEEDTRPPVSHEAERIRATERARLHALLTADMDAARPLHAEDFQLITPRGNTLSREEYLEAVASGILNYLVMELEPDSIEVRLYGRSAVVRYRSRLEVALDGRRLPPGRFWHTDTYEKRDGRWQVVWSQATEIQ